MELIALKCPNCGAKIECESIRELIYCQYCGHKIIIKEEKDVQKVTVDNSAALVSTIELAIAALSNHNYREAMMLINRALEYDGNCLDAMLLKVTIERIAGRDGEAYAELAKKCTNNLNLFSADGVEKYTRRPVYNVSAIQKAFITLPDTCISANFKKFEVYDEYGISGRSPLPGKTLMFCFTYGKPNVIKLVEVEKGLINNRRTYQFTIYPVEGAYYKLFANDDHYEIKKID